MVQHFYGSINHSSNSSRCNGGGDGGGSINSNILVFQLTQITKHQNPESKNDSEDTQRRLSLWSSSLRKTSNTTCLLCVRNRILTGIIEEILIIYIFLFNVSLNFYCVSVKHEQQAIAKPNVWWSGLIYPYLLPSVQERSSFFLQNPPKFEVACKERGQYKMEIDCFLYKTTTTTTTLLKSYTVVGGLHIIV